MKYVEVSISCTTRVTFVVVLIENVAFEDQQEQFLASRDCVACRIETFILLPPKIIIDLPLLVSDGKLNLINTILHS